MDQSNLEAPAIPITAEAPEAVESPERPGKADRLRSIASLSGMIVLVVAAFALMVWLTSDPARRAAVEGLVQSPMGLVVLFGLAAISSATLILPAPGLALTALAGTAGDPVLVGVVAGLGQAVGELTGYLAGMTGRSLLPDNAVSHRVTGWLQRRGAAVIFVLALVPNPLFDVAGVAAGVARMPIVHYLAAAAAGKTIKNIIIASGASSLGGLVAVISSVVP